MKYSIKSLVTSLITEDKSKFIGYLAPFESINEFNLFLDKLKKEHYKAKHICYAYLIKDKSRAYEDNEPKGSAGIPLLNALIQKDLIDSGIIVVRYFGGILLGQSKLTRTYYSSFLETYKKAILVKVLNKTLYKISLDYDLYEIFLNYIKKYDFNIKNTSFFDKILVEFSVDPEFNFNEFNSKFLNRIDLLEIKEIIERREL